MYKALCLLSVVLVGCVQTGVDGEPLDLSDPGVQETLRNELNVDVQEVTLVGPSGQIQVKAEIADDPGKRQKGLMHRTSLPDDHGMLFVFNDLNMLSFWMKDTFIPLDVIYFDNSGKYVSYHTMKPCEKDPCPTYRSVGVAQYALEVNAGLAEQWGIGRDWALDIAAL